MAPKSFLKGHEIYFSNGEWLYKDNKEPTVNNIRDCGHCDKPNRKDGHDPCLGALPGVMNACCGHGRPNESYVQFNNGMIIRGFNRIEFFKLKNKQKEQRWKVLSSLYTRIIAEKFKTEP